MTTPNRKPTKADLIAEIKALRNTGAHMANLCYLLSQRIGVPSENLCQLMKRLSNEWDAIPRCEVNR